MKDLMTIEQARQTCSISFAHAWYMVTSGKWTPVRIGAGARIIRVRISEVEATKAEWEAADRAKRESYRTKSKRKPRRAATA